MQEPQAMVVVLGTGGTVAGRLDPHSDIPGAYKAGQLPLQLLVDDLRNRVRGTGWPPIDVEQVAQIDSKDMDVTLWQCLVSRLLHHLARSNVCGVVIAHGTDTLEETAVLLKHMLDTHKPVVLVGAMKPADARDADGPQNLLDGILVASDPKATGVLMTMAGQVHEGWWVRKCHPVQFAAFASGDTGPIGIVKNERVEWLREPTPPLRSLEVLLFAQIQQSWPRVEIVTSHAAADGRIVDLLVADGVEGLVVAGTGNGTVHQSLADALVRARDAGVSVCRCTRITSTGLPACEVFADPEASELTPAQARVALQLALLKAKH